MADIRIKDLTTTASSTASDDFIAVDGTTNGTRKLSAFSPTFGGNATVTGTLTVNSTSSFAGLIQLNNNVAQYWLDSGATQRRTALVSSGNATYFGPIDAGWGSTGYFSAGTSLILRTNGASGTFNEAVSISTGGNVSIASTSASTTTSTGALVVSGGVGIGGSLNAGANNAANSITGGDSGSGTYILQLKDGGGNLKVNFKGNGDVNLQSSTASTSTSSGALVVSGGVGVAGAIYAGGGISTKLSTNNSGSNLFAITRADGTTPLLTATDASDGLTLKFGYTGLGNSSNWVSASGTGAGTAITINNGVVASLGGVIYQVNGLSRWYLSRDASTSESGSNVGSDFLITAYNDAGSSLGAALTIKRSDYAATFGGSIKTAAPSGGTAANWKLGTVATVSPTSPNRTIEVDIGGTIYYIHAKTTNN